MLVLDANYIAGVERVLLNVSAAYRPKCRRIFLGENLTFSQGWQDWYLWHNLFRRRDNALQWGGGFYIDIGNGHSMLLPSVLWLFNVMIGAPLSPQWLGICGIICFYQMWYGTLLYFTSFFANKHHHGKTVTEVVLFVGVSNGIWFTFPLLGIWASIQLVLTGSFGCLVC